MNILIGCSISGIHQYPPHSHDRWEISCYTEGSGVCELNGSSYPFRPGTTILLPPGTVHYTASEHTSIYIHGDFEHLLMFDEPLAVSDNEHGDAVRFARMIYRNRYGRGNYISSLCNTYIAYLLQEATLKNGLADTVRRISEQIIANAFDCNIDVSSFLSSSGYAEDYIRMRFRENIGMSPLRFLTKIRMDHACLLLDSYRDQLPLTQIAEQCGYTDYVYFSKLFKKATGMSPQKYLKRQR